MILRTLGQVVLAAFAVTALAGCVTTTPAPVATPIVIQAPTAPGAAVVVTPRTY